jgi:hypothetical protein
VTVFHDPANFGSEQWPMPGSQPARARTGMPTWGWAMLIVFAFAAGVSTGVLITPSESNSPNTPSNSTPSSAAQVPSYSYTSTTTTPAVLPTPDEFRIDVVVTKKDCYGSAGCNITFEINPTYTGTKSLKNSSFRVVYNINGGDSPKVGSFTVTNGTAHYDRSGSISTDSEYAVLTATVTQVIPN